MNIAKLCGVPSLSILLLAGPFLGQAQAMIPADFDDDGDVDLADFAEFQTCAMGPDINQTDQACTDARLDADPDVDLDDFAVFQDCLSGADNPADPNCACPSGETNCGGTCVSTANNNANCGDCGNACGTGLVCQNGTCASCPVDTILCGAFCVYWDSDIGNCGSCGHACGGGEQCYGGECHPADPCGPECGGGRSVPPGDGPLISGGESHELHG